MKLSKFSSFANTFQGKTSLPINLKYGQYNLLLNSPKQSCIEPMKIKDKRYQDKRYRDKGYQDKRYQDKGYQNQIQVNIKDIKNVYQSQKLIELKQTKVNHFISHDKKEQKQDQKKQIKIEQSKPYPEKHLSKESHEISKEPHEISKESHANANNQFVQINMIKDSQLWVKNKNKSFAMLKQERVINQPSEYLTQKNHENVLDKTFDLIQKLDIPSNDQKLTLDTQRQKINQKIDESIYQILTAQSNFKNYKNDPITNILSKKIDYQVQILQTLLNLQHKIKLKKLKLIINNEIKHNLK